MRRIEGRARESYPGLRWVALTCCLLAAPAVAGEVDEALARGDEAWARRAEGREGLRAAAGPIEAAVAAYEEALAADPESLVARSRLLRALYFQGDYSSTVQAERKAIFERATDLAEEGLDQIAEPFGSRKSLDKRTPDRLVQVVGHDPEVARTFFWAAVHWGLWGREHGAFRAARKGVAGKIRDYAEATIQIDESVENGGGHRILGRLHFEAPDIPLVTGWVDHRRSIEILRRAHELAPEDLLTKVYLAEALYEYGKGEEEQARELLEAVVGAEPGPDYLLEDLRSQEMARELLEKWS